MNNINLLGNKLWTKDELQRATGGISTGTWDWVKSVSIDSRTLGGGALFIALRDQRDGHEFVGGALEAGAAAALVSRVPEGLSEDAPLLIVEDSFRALQAMGRKARARAGYARMIGVTGSVGKTSVKRALAHVLGMQGHTHASEKSYNNHWGVPLTLARMPFDTDFGVFEIGMNHSGEITPLSEMVRPDIALITTIAPAHLAHFNHISRIAEAKAEIFAGLKRGGVAILNRDIEWFDLLADRARLRKARILSFGTHAGADFRLERYSVRDGQARIEASLAGREVAYQLAAPGRHHALNSLAVLACVSAAGADVERAMRDLACLQPGAGRGERWQVAGASGSFTLIDESYNANPASVAAALEGLLSFEPQPVSDAYRARRIAVLGDMLELGADELELHAGLARLNRMRMLDTIHCAGPLMQVLYEALPEHQRGFWAENSAALAKALQNRINPGDIVMVKGSLGSRMKLIVDMLKAEGHPSRLRNESMFEDA